MTSRTSDPPAGLPDDPRCCNTFDNRMLWHPPCQGTAEPCRHPMIELRPLSVDEVAARIDEIAALRIAVSRHWPYLYDGDPDYERAYLTPYRTDPRALIVGAFYSGQLVGVSSAIPLEAQSDQIVLPMRNRPQAVDTILYCSEPMLTPLCRGRGIGNFFFNQRETWARALGRPHIAFCTVIRPPDHPCRPAGDQGHNAFWMRRGYRPVPDALAELAWRDVGAPDETTKLLQFWMLTLA